MPDLELIVLDDCSTDRTVEIVRHYASKDPRIRLQTGAQNVGVAQTRNNGIDMSRGKYIALLDSDDTWHPRKLEKQLETLKNAGAVLCYCSYAIVDDTNQKIRNDYLVPGHIDYRELLKENVIGCSTVLAETRVLKEHKFRTDFYHEDYVLWLELLRNGYKAVGDPEVLVNWCYQENSRSYNKWRCLKNRWQIYRQMENLPMIPSICNLLCYVTAGFKKYRRSHDQ
jgi:teichuronic acid biosynthesis glycosyltransferase TuaG